MSDGSYETGAAVAAISSALFGLIALAYAVDPATILAAIGTAGVISAVRAWWIAP